jgi:MoaA/NifB/PqqE/SkfB family radical SAM enzyme
MPKEMDSVCLKWVSPFWYLGCEQNCKECFIGEKKNVVTPLDERKRTIDVLAESGTEEMFLCGGNPILDPLISETVDYIHSKGILIELLSNSWNFTANKSIDDIDDFLTKIDDKAATFWGMDAKTHDESCGCKGSFDRLVENLEIISEKDYSIDAIVNVMPKNKCDVYKTIKALRQRVNITKVWIQRMFPYGNALMNNYAEMQLKPEDINLVLEQLLRAKADFDLEDISFDSVPPFCMVDKKYYPFVERYKRGLSFWALDNQCRLFGESLDVMDPSLALFGGRPIYEVDNPLEKIKSDRRTLEILGMGYLPEKCRNCGINECFGGYLVRNGKKNLRVDPMLG